MFCLFVPLTFAIKKLHALNTLLEKLAREKHKVLLFCTMTRVLDILQDYMDFKNWRYQRLDGSVRADERSLAVNAFQADDGDVFCFLLSTRAGGQGLNLTAADYVIFYDQDWNPQVDLQAQARAHRIGQTKPVTIIRFVVRHSVEEILFRRSRSKLWLSQAVIEQGRQGADVEDVEATLTSKDLLELIQFGVANLEQSGDEPVLTLQEDDLTAMIHDAWSKQDKIQGPSELKRAKTIVAVKEGAEEDENDDMYIWNGVNQRDTDYIQSLAAQEQKVASQRPARPSSLDARRALSEAERKQRNEQKQKKLAESWKRNGYESLKLSEAPPPLVPVDESDFDFSGSADQDGDMGIRDLNYVNGNAAHASFGDPARPKIVVCVINSSGDWPARGGLFGSITAVHGDAISEAYEQCASNKDCHLGDVHLVPSGRVANQ